METPLTPGLTLDQHSMDISVKSWLIFSWCIWVIRQSTDSVSTDCWSSVNRASTAYWSGSTVSWLDTVHLSSQPWFPTETMVDHSVNQTFILVNYLFSSAALTISQEMTILPTPTHFCLLDGIESQASSSHYMTYWFSMSAKVSFSIFFFVSRGWSSLSLTGRVWTFSLFLWLAQEKVMLFTSTQSTWFLVGTLLLGGRRAWPSGRARDL